MSRDNSTSNSIQPSLARRGGCRLPVRNETGDSKKTCVIVSMSQSCVNTYLLCIVCLMN